jgi:hypothetical protein
MINVPSVYGQDWESMIAKARQNILNKISRILGEDISKLILFEEQLTPQLYKIKHILIRVPYGTSSNSRFAAFFHKTFLLNIKPIFLRWQCASWWRNPVGSHQQKSLRN